MHSEYLDTPETIAGRKAAQPYWITDEGRNVNGFIRAAYAPDGGEMGYGKFMADPADNEYVWVLPEDEVH